jgi:D-alanyl-D-alanine carboxypeptidase
MAILAASILATAAEPAEARKRHRRAKPYNPPYAAFVIDANSGKVLLADNADKLRHPASLTKIMTLYLLFEQMEAGKIAPDTALPVSEEAAAQAPSKLGLRPGQTIPVDHAIKALVTKSANDVAVVIAEALAGDEESFAKLMTRKARALGMTRTTYRNASGLPDDEQVTTARDQVLLGRAIQDVFPGYYRYFSIASFNYHGRPLRNHNHLLGRVEGMDGIKTGYTRASGFNLVTSVHRGSRHIVAAVLGGRSARWRDARMQGLIEKFIDDGATRRTLARITDTTNSADARLRKPTPAEPAGNEPAAAIAMNDHPIPGSLEPIRAVPVRTLSVRPGMMRPPAIAEGSSAAPVNDAARALSSFDPARPKIDHPGAVPTPRIAAAYAAEPASPAPASGGRAGSPEPIAARGGWLIQVGAFEDEGQAKERLQSVKSTAPAVIRAAEPFTERVVTRGKTYYRARFAGFDKERAHAACHALKNNDVACIALKN